MAQFEGFRTNLPLMFLLETFKDIFPSPSHNSLVLFISFISIMATLKLLIQAPVFSITHQWLGNKIVWLNT